MQGLPRKLMVQEKDEVNQVKGVDREKSAVFKELTQSFRTYELRGQAEKKKKKKKKL